MLCLSLTAQLFGATRGDRRCRKGHVSGIDLMYFCAEGLAGTQWREKVDLGRKLNTSDNLASCKAATFDFFFFNEMMNCTSAGPRVYQSSLYFVCVS